MAIALLDTDILSELLKQRNLQGKGAMHLSLNSADKS